ncbi:hypothetical protein CE91St58_09810 [Lachnospiraceae bacterium]|uniref:hypothetical protein n=1 Tax=Eisenbergiella porci TaxID=2652274 RepID=UPI002085BE94|nr:hypothetical protein CE91St58_09810 [Lachnospiraceae bacterium]
MATYNVDLQDDQGNSYRTMANPDSKAEFTEATSRENINSGETHRTIFGKLRKFLSDLGAAAYIAIANNCTTTAAGFALDARQGKVLMDKSNQISSDLGGYKFGTTTDGKPGYIVPGGADTVLPFSQGVKLVYNNSSYASSYTFGEEGDYIVSSCVCKEGWNEKGDPVITLNVASIYANYQKTMYTGNNVETAACFSYVHAKIGNTCTTTITGIDDTRHGYLTILKVG